MLLNICIRYERMRCSRIKQHNCISVVDKKRTHDHVWRFLHCDMIDLSVNIVMSSSNRNRISPTGRHRGGHSCLRRAVAWIEVLVGKVTFLPTSVAPPFTLLWVMSSLSPLNTLIPSSRSLEVIGALHHLALRGRLSLPSYLWLQLKQRLSRLEHRSSYRHSDMQSRATAWLMLMHQLTLALHHASAVL
jgi:hypothetical protein